MVLNEINHWSRDFVEVNFHFENRECNFEAHALAKVASSLTVGRQLWQGTVACIPDALNFE